MLIAKELDIDEEQALSLFYQSRTYQMLKDPHYGLQTMSDMYIYDEFILEEKSKDL